MKATYIQTGNVIEYPAAEAIAYGDVVVMPDRIGVALTDIAAGAIGSVALTGAYDMPAVGEIALGSRVFYDPDNDAIVTRYETSDDPDDPDPNANLVPAGLAIASKAGADEGMVRVRLG